MTSIDAKIVVDSYQLSMAIFKISRNFPKQYRPTLGRRLEDGSINLTLFIRIASLASKKLRRITLLEKSSEYLDEIRLLSQMCYDLQIIPIVSYGEISNMTLDIGRQLGAFLKYTQTEESQ